MMKNLAEHYLSKCYNVPIMKRKSGKRVFISY